MTYCITQPYRSLWWIIRLYLNYNGPIWFVYLCNFCVLYNFMLYIKTLYCYSFDSSKSPTLLNPSPPLTWLSFVLFRCLSLLMKLSINFFRESLLIYTFDCHLISSVIWRQISVFIRVVISTIYRWCVSNLAHVDYWHSDISPNRSCKDPWAKYHDKQ